MLKIFKNRYLDALGKFVLLSAILHVIFLVAFFLKDRDAVAFNYFHLIGAYLIFPGIIKGFFSQILSFVIVIVLYIIILLFYTDKQKC
jgi:hypothetical protein